MKKKLNCILMVADDGRRYLASKSVIDRANIARCLKSFESANTAITYLTTAAGGDEDFPFPDIIVLDITQPHQSAWQFLINFQKIKVELPHHPVIMMLYETFTEDDILIAPVTSNIAGIYPSPLTREAFQSIIIKYFPQGAKSYKTLY